MPKTWVGNMNEVVDLYVRGLIPALPRVGVGYSLEQQQLAATSRRTTMATLQTLPDATTVLPAGGSGCATPLAMRSFLYAVFKHRRLVLGVFSAVFLGSAVAAFLRQRSGSRAARCW